MAISSVQFLLFVAFLAGFSSAVHVAVKNSNELTSTYCIILDANITGTINYNNKDNMSVEYAFAVNGTSVSADGDCHAVLPSSDSSVEYAEISFFPNDLTLNPVPRDRWTIRLTFRAPDSLSPPVKSFVIADYKLNAFFYPEIFNATKPSETYERASSASLEWSAEGRHGFSCSNSELSLAQNSKLIFGGLKVVAFALLDKPTFLTDQLFEQCQLDTRTSDLVPIIVGACLAGLVIVVLIAYVIGRARAKRQGYASV